jgi:tetratricopeptide (TPR) repeat protein
MRRGTFLRTALVGAIFADTSWIRADAANGQIAVYRAAVLVGTDSDLRYDVALEYSFPAAGQQTIYIDEYGRVPPSGYLRFVTQSQTITVRSDLSEDHSQDMVLGAVNLDKLHHDFEYLSNIDLANIDDVARSLVTGSALYGLGKDQQAIVEYTGVLWDRRRNGVWSSQARLGRADASVNAADLALARRDYEWILKRPRHYTKADRGSALLGYARVLTQLGDFRGAINAYTEAQELYRRITRPPVLSMSGVSLVRSDRRASIIWDAVQIATNTKNTLTGSGLAAATIGVAASKVKQNLFLTRGIQIAAPGSSGRRLKSARLGYDVGFESEMASEAYDKLDHSDPWVSLSSGRFSMPDITNTIGDGQFFATVEPYANNVFVAYVSTWSSLTTGPVNGEAIRCATIIETTLAGQDKRATGVPYRLKIVTVHRQPRGATWDNNFDPRSVDQMLVAAAKDFSGLVVDLCRNLANA